MPGNIIDEYLVSLGFQVNSSELNHLRDALRTVESSVHTSMFHMERSILHWQGEAVGAFAAVGAAALGFADHVAQSDLNMQLYAAHLMTTVSAARSLHAVTSTLGHSLADILVSSELTGRARTVLELQERMNTSVLGPNFERNMLQLRNVRFQLSLMELELKNIFAGALSDFVSSHWTQIQSVLKWLQGWVARIAADAPHLSKMLSQEVVPVLKDVWSVLKDMAQLGKQMAILFTSIVGLFTLNPRLASTTFSFKNLASAITSVVNGLKWIVNSVTNVETSLTRITNALTLGLTGHEDAAAKEAGSAAGGVSVGGAIGMGLLGLLTARRVRKFLIKHGSKRAAVRAGAGAAEDAGGEAVAEDAGAGLLAAIPGWGWLAALGVAGAGVGWHYRHQIAGFASKIKNDIFGTAVAAGVPPSMALAVAHQESGFRQFDANGNVLMPHVAGSHAMGLFQLEPGTARMMGVNARTIQGNINGGVGYLAKMRAMFHGNEQQALEAYYAGPGAVQSGFRGHSAMKLAAETYARHVMDYERAVHSASMGSMGSGFGGSPLYVTQNFYGYASPAAVGDAARKGVGRAFNAQRMANIVQTQGVTS